MSLSVGSIFFFLKGFLTGRSLTDSFAVIPEEGSLSGAFVAEGNDQS